MIDFSPLNVAQGGDLEPRILRIVRIVRNNDLKNSLGENEDECICQCVNKCACHRNSCSEHCPGGY